MTLTCTMSAFIPPESQEHNETFLEEETNAGRLGQEAEHETEVGLGMQSEDGPEIGQQQLIEDQSLCHEDLQILQMTPPQMRPSTPQGEPPPLPSTIHQKTTAYSCFYLPILWPANI